jgi:hypothetical protein
MCIHAYFHIWCQARKGWSTLIKRHTATRKIKKLLTFDRQSFFLIKIRKYMNDSQNKKKVIINNDLDEETSSNITSADANEDAETDEISYIKNNDPHFYDSLEIEYENQKHEVCAICYSEICLYQARITDCMHIYHDVRLTMF